MIKKYYTQKSICILGYHTIIGKVLIKKLLTEFQNKNRIFLVDLSTDIKARNQFIQNNYIRIIEGLQNKVDFIHISKLNELPVIDILFNTFVPYDFVMFDKAIVSHIFQTKQTCQKLSKLQIKQTICLSSIFSCPPGFISQTKQVETHIRLPQVKTKQSLMLFIQDTFQSNIQAWQWSLKYMQDMYLKTFNHCGIIRVNLIGPTISQYEGYSDKFNQLTYLIYQVGNNFINYINGRRQTIIDIVPADYIANYFLVVGWSMYNNRLQEKQIVKLDKDQTKKHQIHNLSTSSRHPVNLQQFTEYINEAWKQYNGGSIKIHEKPIMHKILTAKQQIPHIVKQRLARLMDIKSWKIQAQKQEIILSKKKQLTNRFQYFLEHQWISQSNRSIDIFLTLTAQQQIIFSFNVNNINWRIYCKLLVYSIKKYLLGQHVEKFSPNKMDLLKLQKQSYFSDIIWAFTGGKSIQSMNLQTIKNYILSTKSVKESIQALVEGHALKLQKTPTSYENLQAQYQRIAQQMCDQMFSQYQMKSIRMFAWFLHKVFKTIYERVVIDQKAMQKLRNHDQKTFGPFIIIPTHRSYIDFLIMSYVFFGNGIKCPYIAAAQDFLNMAIIHILLRKSGAFFIKRNQQKHRYLYKAIMTQYISKLLVDNNYLQFFVQGTRSRVGKMLAPKYGILNIIAKNVLQGRIPDAHILPVTINYQKILEGTSFTYQLMGQPKVKQSLSRLLKAADVLKQNYGRIYIQICEPISIKSYFETNHGTQFDENINSLGYKIVYELTDKLVITPPAILATSLLMHRKGISDDSLTSSVNWLSKQIASRNIKIARSQSDSSISVGNTLDLLGDVVTKSKKDMFQVQVSFDQSSFTKLFTLTYYRNTLTHIFFEQAIIATALASFGHQNIISNIVSIEQLYNETKFLYTLLNNEYVLKNKLSERNRFNQLVNLLISKNIIRIQNDKIQTLQPNGNLFNLYCSLIWPVAQSYWITSLYLFKFTKSQQLIPLQKFLKQIQWFAQSLITERIIHHLQAISLDTIKNAVAKFKQLKIIQNVKEISNEVEITYVKLGCNENELKKISNKIKKFLKSSYAQSVTGILDSGSSSVNLDFPFLSKL